MYIPTGCNKFIPWQLCDSRWWRKTHSMPITSSKRMETSHGNYFEIWRWQLQGVEVVLIKSWFFFQFPSVLVFAIAMFCASVILPQEYNTENLLFMLFWGSMIGITLKGILRFGSEFVDFPKLLPTVNQNNA